MATYRRTIQPTDIKDECFFEFENLLKKHNLSFPLYAEASAYICPMSGILEIEEFTTMTQNQDILNKGFKVARILTAEAMGRKKRKYNHWNRKLVAVSSERFIDLFDYVDFDEEDLAEEIAEDGEIFLRR